LIQFKSRKTDGLIYLFSTVFAKSVSFISLPIFTKYLSVQEFGIYSMFGLFGLTASGFLSIGIMHASYRYYFELKDNDIDKFKRLNFSNIIFLLSIFSVGFLIIILLKDFLLNIFFKGGISSFIYYTSFIAGAITYLIEYHLLLLTAYKQSLFYAFFTILRPILILIITFILFHNIESSIIAIILGYTSSVSLLLLLIVISSIQQYSPHYSSKYVKESLLFSYPMLPRSIIGQIYNMFDKVMLINYSGFIGVGYYTLASRYSETLKLIMASLDKVWHPYFLEHATKNTADDQNKIINKGKEIISLVMIGGLLITYISQEIIMLLTQSDYHQTALYIPVYMLYYILALINMYGFMQITFAKKMGYLFIGSVGAIITNVAFNILLIPIYGVMGATIATGISALIGSALNAYYGQKCYPLNINFYQIILVILLFIVFSFILYPLQILFEPFSIKLILLKILSFLIFIKLLIQLRFISIIQLIEYKKYVIELIRRNKN